MWELWQQRWDVHRPVSSSIAVWSKHETNTLSYVSSSEKLFEIMVFVLIVVWGHGSMWSPMTTVETKSLWGRWPSKKRKLISLGPTTLLEIYRSSALLYHQTAERLSGVNFYVAIVTTVISSALFIAQRKACRELTYLSKFSALLYQTAECLSGVINFNATVAQSDWGLRSTKWTTLSRAPNLQACWVVMWRVAVE